jgi:hypothetical protein
VGDPIKSEKVGFASIQETKMEGIGTSLGDRIWGSQDNELVYTKANGNSGGLLCLWNLKAFSLIDQLKGDGSVGVCLVCKKLQECVIININSLCDIQGKRKLWSDLSAVKGRYQVKLWCLPGDVNVVLSNNERKGVSMEARVVEMREFKSFF